MRILIYTASSMCNPQLGIQMEWAMRYLNEGHEVVFCHCSGCMRACSANPNGNNALCDFCKIGFKVGLSNLPKKIKVEKLIKRKQMSEFAPQVFHSVSEIKSYKYKGIDVGFSVFSVYVSKTRNPNPLFSNTFVSCINQMLFEAESLIDAAEDIIERVKPDLIIFFNGRFYDTKPFYGIAIKKGIDYITTENIGGVRSDSEYRMVRFFNTIPHDAKQAYKNCLESWEKSTVPEEEKIRLGTEFYEKRRKGIRAGDYVYTGNQIKGKLPDSYDSQKKSIVVYCSSEDEFSSVSEYVDNMFIFKSQYLAIKYFVDHLNSEEYNFYVRIHPNMKGLDFDYHRNLYKLSAYDNVTVIGPEDPTSSYALMDIAYNIIAFGSTIGAESLFWDKPLVLLGHADYYNWGCCQVPRTHEEALEMVKNPIIFQNAKEMSIKYGYYFLENSLAEPAKYIHITPMVISSFGKQVFAFDYLKLLGSAKLYRSIQTFYNRIISKFHRNSIVFPDKIIH